MEYTIQNLAKLAGVSARTLRWYDECGLLKPRRVSSNGYRVYGQAEIDRLQQILFYRELGVELSEIGRILCADGFDAQAALEEHLRALHTKKARLEVLIANVENSMKAMKGEIHMTDDQKFEGFKQKLIDENEAQYGAEIREKYGADTVERSNAKLRGMTKQDYGRVEALTKEVNDALKAAFDTGDPAGALAQKACELHKNWLMCYWDSYSPEAHMGVAQMYVDDPRFTAYYDKIAPGCAVFLRDALRVYLS